MKKEYQGLDHLDWVPSYELNQEQIDEVTTIRTDSSGDLIGINVQ